MMKDAAWDAVTMFVRAGGGLGLTAVLTPATRLCEDLGQTGDEANDFIEKFFKHFEVDAGDFDFHRYFLMEGEGLLYSAFRQWILRKPHTRKREPITLAMLHRVAASKRWNSQVISKTAS